MNNGAAQVPQDKISFAVFTLLLVFLQLDEGVTDFIGSTERKILQPVFCAKCRRVLSFLLSKSTVVYNLRFTSSLVFSV